MLSESEKIFSVDAVTQQVKLPLGSSIFIFEGRFKFWLLHVISCFDSSFLLKYLGRQQMLAQILGHLPPMWETQWSSWLPVLSHLALAVLDIWGAGHQMENLFISFSLSYLLRFSNKIWFGGQYLFSGTPTSIYSHRKPRCQWYSCNKLPCVPVANQSGWQTSSACG